MADAPREAGSTLKRPKNIEGEGCRRFFKEYRKFFLGGMIFVGICGILVAAKNDWFQVSDIKKLGSTITRPLTYVYGLLSHLNSHQR
jgi:hypothetical protein